MNKDVKHCEDIKNEDGKVDGCVCVGPSKDLGKKDIVYMPNDKETFSVRSTTELMNKLRERHIPYEERKSVFNFVSDRLRALEREEISKGLTVGPVSGKTSKKIFGEGKNDKSDM